MNALLSEILAERRQAAAAAGAFTCYNVTTAIGVVTAAEHLAVPVILLVSQASVADSTSRLFLPALGAVADAAAVPVCVQLDHATRLGIIERALATGAVGAVLADGSQQPRDENVAFARAALDLARKHSAELEVELGHVAGGEDVAEAARAGKLTDPLMAEQFIYETGASCLAVSIGNVHGDYATPPVLDWERLELIRRCVPTPLALHGASGLPETDIRRAVAGGIVKINVNTEIRQRTLDVISSQLDYVRNGARVLELNTSVVEAVTDIVKSKLQLFTDAPSLDTLVQ